jgi:C-terminal processing protease CtpA/Prc
MRYVTTARMGAVSLLLCLCALAQTTPAGTYTADLEAYLQQIDNHYPFFGLKNNRREWEAFKERAVEEVKACSSDAAFLGLIGESFKVLHDGHMGFRETKADMPPWPKRYSPGICLWPGAKGEVIVMYGGPKYEPGIPRGTVIAAIDGKPAGEFMAERCAEAWKTSTQSSPQRTSLFEYRMALRGEQGETHELTVENITPDGTIVPSTIRVACEVEARGWAHTYNMPEGLQQVGRSCHYGKLEGGAGYVYLRRVDGSVVVGLKQALDELDDAQGWIIDLRGNGGGGYDNKLIDVVKGMPRPVAVIIDPGCMSAGETLARDFRQYAGARLFGTRTAGCSSSKGGWSFPSGIASLTLASRSRWRADGEPIEYNGIEPDEEVYPTPEDIAAGRNTEILRAEAWLKDAKESGDAKEPVSAQPPVARASRP